MNYLGFDSSSNLIDDAKHRDGTLSLDLYEEHIIEFVCFETNIEIHVNDAFVEEEDTSIHSLILGSEFIVGTVACPCDSIHSHISAPGSHHWGCADETGVSVPIYRSVQDITVHGNGRFTLDTSSVGLLDVLKDANITMRYQHTTRASCTAQTRTTRSP